MSFSRYGAISNADVDAAEDVAIIECGGFKMLWLSFIVGVANLSAFTVEYRLNGAAAWMPMAATEADYTTPNFPVLRASGNLAAAAFGSTNHYVALDVTGIHSIRVRAAGTSSTITGSFSLG